MIGMRVRHAWVAGGIATALILAPAVSAQAVRTAHTNQPPPAKTFAMHTQHEFEEGTYQGPFTGFLIGLTEQRPDGTTGYTESAIGGTSLAAPLFAGLVVDAQQKAGHPAVRTPCARARRQ